MGALLDGFIALATGGVAGVLVPELSPKFRGTDEWLPKQTSPGRPGAAPRSRDEARPLKEHHALVFARRGPTSPYQRE